MESRTFFAIITELINLFDETYDGESVNKLFSRETSKLFLRVCFYSRDIFGSVIK